MDRNDAHNGAGTAAQGYQNLQCFECAANIRSALSAVGIQGKQIELRGRSSRGLIVCFSYDEGGTAVSRNGSHVGIRVDNVVYDNLHPSGMPFDDWLDDFDSVGGVFVERVEDF